jgi:hypothetical protein
VCFESLAAMELAVTTETFDGHGVAALQPVLTKDGVVAELSRTSSRGKDEGFRTSTHVRGSGGRTGRKAADGAV